MTDAATNDLGNDKQGASQAEELAKLLSLLEIVGTNKKDYSQYAAMSVEELTLVCHFPSSRLLRIKSIDDTVTKLPEGDPGLLPPACKDDG
jgi:hypothetical protein